MLLCRVKSCFAIPQAAAGSELGLWIGSALNADSKTKSIAFDCKDMGEGTAWIRKGMIADPY